MKTLLAIRHALPSPNFEGPDHDRPLEERGIQNCIKMGQHLRTNAFHPTAIISSTAARALSTARLLAEQLDFPVENIVEIANGYLAPKDHWLAVVQQLPEQAETAMIVGHNPGIAQFAIDIQKDPEYLSFPPLSIAKLQFDLKFWGEIDWRTATLLEYLNPSKI